MREKPLNVRVAEALGWTTRLCDGDCRCTQWIPPGSNTPGIQPPYGDDTPEGWACTGPLIGRFGLTLEKQGCSSAAYECWDDKHGLVWFGATACAAVAEWVARHGKP